MAFDNRQGGQDRTKRFHLDVLRQFTQFAHPAVEVEVRTHQRGL
ncbi:hypothetical protein ACIP1G_02290 [Pseudomonas sp. NPDC089392]